MVFILIAIALLAIFGIAVLPLSKLLKVVLICLILLILGPIIALIGAWSNVPWQGTKLARI
jgi:hypothetical protein